MWAAGWAFASCEVGSCVEACTLPGSFLVCQFILMTEDGDSCLLLTKRSIQVAFLGGGWPVRATQSSYEVISSVGSETS